MEDLKIGIHRQSCKNNKFSDKDFIDILKNKLKKFNPNFFSELHPVDANYPFGYTTLSAVNLEESERNEIMAIIEDTFKDLKNSRIES